MIRAILAIVLAGMLTACGGGTAPSQSLVEKAIELQLNQTQQELTQQLFRGAAERPNVTVSRVKVKDRQRLAIDDLTGYRVRGVYDLTLDSLKQHTTQRQNPFEVYLQRQIEGKTWRLARQAGDRWVTQLIEE